MIFVVYVALPGWKMDTFMPGLIVKYREGKYPDLYSKYCSGD